MSVLIAWELQARLNNALKGTVDCNVFWPSAAKAERGQTPYVEYVIGSHTWHAHFMLPDKHRYDDKPYLRPRLYYVKVKADGQHHLYMWVSAEEELGIISKQVVPARTSTK